MISEKRLNRGIIKNVAIKNVAIKNVAIIVQPHQEISSGQNSQNRKYGVERVVTYLIEGLLNRNVDVSLYTAKNCSIDCRVIYPIGFFDGNFGDTIFQTQLLTYSRKIREDLECRTFDVINNHYDLITFVAIQNIETPTITTLHVASPRSLYQSLRVSNLLSYK